jgi:hypothetical protein
MTNKNPIQEVPDLYVQKVDGLIRSGFNLNKVAMFNVDRQSGVINLTLTFVVGVSYVVSLTTEAELEAFVAKLEKIIN